jgi:hypothetical protein
VVPRLRGRRLMTFDLTIDPQRVPLRKSRVTDPRSADRFR